MVIFQCSRSPPQMNALRRALINKKERRGQAKTALRQARMLGVNL